MFDESILTSTKKVLGIDAEYDAFDLDVKMHINSAFATLNQLGVGPEEGFMIEDETATWGDFIGVDKRLNSVPTYVYLKVRLAFDPPSTSFVIESQKKQLEELEWRLNVVVEGDRV
ncbi:virion structural protein [Rhodococcus phage ReqiPoco6]|uniref:Gp014 n=1 Tax=Rhodococcus phage ReqiPoco6 TaxID=691964 RepID=D4P7N2_9CAUD|nr:virion structural protein [Rhodococcus phage ReqiPoco6]ADD81012.1 gp014 [Rhodococcus phage ReqiPoco6]